MCLLQLPQRKEEDSSHGNNTLVKQPRGRNGPQPSVQTATNSLISKSCILILTSEMWKTGTISFQLVRKEFTIHFWHDPKGKEFKEGINTFNDYILCARPCAQCFRIIILFNLHHNLGRQLTLSPFY